MAAIRLLLSCCLVLGFMYSCPSLARASPLIPTTFRRQLSSDHDNTSKEASIFRAELVHRDHVDSPLRPPTGTTAAERLAAAANRSELRVARRQLLGAAAAATEVQDLTAITSGIGEYVMTIHVGTPPQKFVVIVDSGSDLVWVQCSACNLTSHVCFPSPDPFFDPSASSSYVAVPCNSSQCDPNQFIGVACVDTARSCGISYAYQDGSGIAGDLSTETITLSNSFTGVPSTISDFLFGCMNNDTGTFQDVDGLVGFGRGPNSLPSQITQSTTNNAFSYCLVPFTAATALTSALLFGFNVDEAYELPVVRTPVFTYEETLYWVNMIGISINGTDLKIPSSAFEFNSTSGERGAFFDSGTTFVYLNPGILATVVKSLEGLISYPWVNGTDYGLPLCYNVTGVKQPRFPSMSFQFSGVNGTDVVEFPLTDSNIFVPVIDEADGVTPVVECLAMQSTGADAGNMIIGNIAQADHYIQYDVTNLQLGWTGIVDCSLPLV